MAKLAQSSFALDLLRRLLCAHAAGNAGNTVHADAAALRPKEEEEGEGAAARSPCIVARLMGLDAMPTPPRERDQQATLRRSRSASSAEGGWSSPTPCCFGDAPRRRVVRTTSASFRDRPTYLRRENDQFLLLSFSPDDDGGDDFEAAGLSISDDDDAEKAGSTRVKRTVDGEGAKKQRRGRRRLPRRRRGDEEAEPDHGRSRRPAASAEEECGLENSSPVSVLEARDGQEESSTTTTASSSSVEELEPPCSPSSDGGETRPAPRQQQQQRSRRKPPQANSDNLGGDLRHAAASSSSCVSKCSDRERRDRRVVKNKAEAIAPDATSIWRIICGMVEQDICGINWQARGGGDIAAELGSEILDQLIWEQTAELMQLIVV